MLLGLDSSRAQHYANVRSSLLASQALKTIRLQTEVRTHHPHVTIIYLFAPRAKERYAVQTKETTWRTGRRSQSGTEKQTRSAGPQTRNTSNTSLLQFFV
mmetsp:Transcript_59973/g.140103  ORF Transcript_59973/g.140103 Transcript_59973/m.140103 type:complete len:100 (+) Transcript_59973:75-374(+)